MYKILITLAYLCLPALAFTQHKHDYVWNMGYGFPQGPPLGGTELDFNHNEPVRSVFELPYNFTIAMPCSISDGEGNLQFYANGCEIINYEHEKMENGDDISPGYYHDIFCDGALNAYYAYQSNMILPRPGHLGQYVYFHHVQEFAADKGSILYSEIDMNANGGKGKVVKKNQLLRGPVNEELAYTSIKHANGRDWWIIIPETTLNIYNSYLLTPDTIEGPFTYNLQDSIASLYENQASWNAFVSPDGTKLGRVGLTLFDVPNRFNRIFLCDFDRCTGTVSNPETIKVEDPESFDAWAQISPNSRVLYLQIGKNKLFQYDLQAQDIAASQQLIAEYDGFVGLLGVSTDFKAMAQAPNNKIYMTTNSTISHYYHTIHKPDRLGLACDFRQHDFELPTYIDNLMPLYPNFRLGPLDGSSCDTLGLDNLPVANFRWEVEETLSPLQVEFTDLSYFEPATWLWDFGDGSTSQDTSPVHAYAAPGIYQVCLTVCNPNDCHTQCQAVEVEVVGTSIVQGAGKRISISPNPARSTFTVKGPWAGNAQLSLLDLQGRVLLSKTFTGAEVLTELDASIPSGIYLVKIQTEDGAVYMAKLVVGGK